MPFSIGGREAGAVARGQLPLLLRWPQALQQRDGAVVLTAPDPDRDAVLATINAELHAHGAIHGWRNERIRLSGLACGTLLARTERAAARFWGSLTLGAHATGYTADAQGRPVALWVARRAFDKPTDPGLLDNLVGGGVPAHQTPMQALVRESFEEAGVPDELARSAQPGRVLHVLRDRAEGLQREDLHSYDLRLPEDWQPLNQDGEVEDFERLPWREALDLAYAQRMTLDAALVTLDFVQRHRLLPDAEGAALGAALQHLAAEAAPARVRGD